MARSKRKEHKYPVSKTANSPAPARQPVSNVLDLTDYMLLNGLFAGFCLLQLVIVRVLLPNALGLYFFFGFLIVSFAIVSAIDYLGAKITDGDAAPQQEPVTE